MIIAIDAKAKLRRTTAKSTFSHSSRPDKFGSRWAANHGQRVNASEFHSWIAVECSPMAWYVIAGRRQRKSICISYIEPVSEPSCNLVRKPSQARWRTPRPHGNKSGNIARYVCPALLIRRQSAAASGSSTLRMTLARHPERLPNVFVAGVKAVPSTNTNCLSLRSIECSLHCGIGSVRRNEIEDGHGQTRTTSLGTMAQSSLWSLVCRAAICSVHVALLDH